MSDEWTYPICVMCGAAVLSTDDGTQAFADGECHVVCPSVEDLAELPLVERAAIVCAMFASCATVDDAQLIDTELAVMIGADWKAVWDLAVRAFDASARIPIVDRRRDGTFTTWAIAEAMLRNGEVQP